MNLSIIYFTRYGPLLYVSQFTYPFVIKLKLDFACTTPTLNKEVNSFVILLLEKI